MDTTISRTAATARKAQLDRVDVLLRDLSGDAVTATLTSAAYSYNAERDDGQPWTSILDFIENAAELARGW
jgi:hypothetical protein